MALTFHRTHQIRTLLVWVNFCSVCLSVRLFSTVLRRTQRLNCFHHDKLNSSNEIQKNNNNMCGAVWQFGSRSLYSYSNVSTVWKWILCSLFLSLSPFQLFNITYNNKMAIFYLPAFRFIGVFFFFWVLLRIFGRESATTAAFPFMLLIELICG